MTLFMEEDLSGYPFFITVCVMPCQKREIVQLFCTCPIDCDATNMSFGHHILIIFYFHLLM